MQKKCQKCGKNDMRVWDAMNGKMFLQCKACHWTSKDLPWTREAKEEWNHLNQYFVTSFPAKSCLQDGQRYIVVYPVLHSIAGLGVMENAEKMPEMR